MIRADDGRGARPSPLVLLLSLALVVGLFLGLLLAGGCARALREPPPPGDPPAWLDPRSGEALYQQGLQAHGAGDTARAEQYLAAALERGHPAEEVVPALLAVCILADRYDTALYYARARLLGNPTDWPLRYLVATLQLAIGQHGRAREQIRQLLELQPDRPEAHYLLAVLRRDHEGDLRGAARAFARYLARAPRGRHALEARAHLGRQPNRRGRP